MTPDITLLDNNWFFEVHHTQAPFNNGLWSLTGMVRGSAPNTLMYLMGKNRNFSSGISPVVTANNNKKIVISYDDGQGRTFGGDITTVQM